MDIVKGDNKMTITQGKMIENVLQKVNLDKCKGMHTPMAHDAAPDSFGEIMNVPFRQLVGCLISISRRTWLHKDADWSGDKEDRKSTSGSAVFYARNLVSWQSVKPRTVALSTAEAEYVAAAQKTCEVLHLHGFLQSVSASDSVPVLFCDNQSAIHMMNNQENSKRSKHIDIRVNFLKDVVAKKQLVV
ncbi:hypothetical protein PR048_021631 [Dryococelus australis]|uniref:Polyprotein n=1 Tax=Dryococelus australis TaxID=614101 RepID=A0ABQ9GYW7_9NEOP|nr:hypothetical protein PR048_021631 [Dryococelus australis]